MREILWRARRSVDLGALRDERDWMRLVKFKAADREFWALVDNILADGFTVPICIRRTHEGWVLGNGHHRFCAAVLLALDVVPVVFSDTTDYMRIDETTGDCQDSSAWAGTISADRMLAQLIYA